MNDSLLGFLFWMLGHVTLSTGILLPKLKCFLPLSLLFLVTSYLVKPDTFDLIPYLEYFKNPAGFEYLFDFCSKILNQYGLDSMSILIFWKLLILLILVLTAFVFSIQKWSHTILLILASPFFFLGSQNVLRQAVSACFIFLGIAFFIEKKSYSIGLICFILSAFFHTSGVFFASLFLLSFVLSNLVNVNIILKLFLGLLVGVGLLLIALYAPIESGLIQNYFHRDIRWDVSINRTPSVLKALAIISVFGYSEFVLNGKVLTHAQTSIRKFRAYLLAFCVVFLMQSEFFSRLLFFYYGIEIFLFILIFQTLNKSRAVRLMLAINVLIYGFLPNVVTILFGGAQGKGWSIWER